MPFSVVLLYREVTLQYDGKEGMRMLKRAFCIIFALAFVCLVYCVPVSAVEVDTPVLPDEEEEYNNVLSISIEAFVEDEDDGRWIHVRSSYNALSSLDKMHFSAFFQHKILLWWRDEYEWSATYYHGGSVTFNRYCQLINSCVFRIREVATLYVGDTVVETFTVYSQEYEAEM